MGIVVNYGFFLIVISVMDWGSNIICVLVTKFLEYVMGYDFFRIIEFIRNSFGLGIIVSIFVDYRKILREGRYRSLKIK